LYDGYSLATHTFQTAHLPILPLTAILYMAAKEQPDVTSRQLNSLAGLLCSRLSILQTQPNLAYLVSHYSELTLTREDADLNTTSASPKNSK